MKMTAYYAHCVALYNTQQETRDIVTITDLGYMCYNPNNPICDAGYKREGMPFFHHIIEACDLVVFRGTPEGRIPAGVAYEIDYAKNLGKPVIELPSGISLRTMTVQQTREYIAEVGKR